jgi:hypothetical protein
LTERRYEGPNREYSRRVLRVAFLDAVARVEPRVLRDLQGEPKAAFVRAADAYFPGQPGEERHRQARLLYLREALTLLGEQLPPPPDRDHFDLLQQAAPDGVNPPLRTRRGEHDLQLRRALHEWGDRWNLSAPWCLLAALRTLDAWVFEGARELRWSHEPAEQSRPRAAIRPVPYVYRFNLPSLLSAPRARVERALVKSFSKHLKAILDDVEWSVKAAGFAVSPGKGEADHATWCARHVVRGEPFSRIARRKNVERTRQAVAEAIKDYLSLIELRAKSESGDAGKAD